MGRCGPEDGGEELKIGMNGGQGLEGAVAPYINGWMVGQSLMLMTLLMHNFWVQEEIQIHFKKHSTSVHCVECKLKVILEKNY